jgi:hypothetical protein
VAVESFQIYNRRAEYKQKTLYAKCFAGGVKSVLQQRLLNDALFKLTLPFSFVASVYNSAFVQREGKFT